MNITGSGLASMSPGLHEPLSGLCDTGHVI